MITREDCIAVSICFKGARQVVLLEICYVDAARASNMFWNCVVVSGFRESRPLWASLPTRPRQSTGRLVRRLLHAAGTVLCVAFPSRRVNGGATASALELCRCTAVQRCHPPLYSHPAPPLPFRCAPPLPFHCAPPLPPPPSAVPPPRPLPLSSHLPSLTMRRVWLFLRKWVGRLSARYVDRTGARALSAFASFGAERDAREGTQRPCGRAAGRPADAHWMRPR